MIARLMKFQASVLLLLGAQLLFGQVVNHLPNPGFEEFILCPDSNQFDGYISDWLSTAQLGIDGGSIGWYHHNCNPSAFGSPPDALRQILIDGVIRVRPGLQTISNIELPGFIYAQLTAPLQRDSLYYFEYTSSSNSWLVDDSELPDLPRDNWCISPDRGFVLTVDPPTLDTINPLKPYARVQEFGRSQLESGAVRLGQCYRATGTEKYFVYGQFFGPADDVFCLVNQFDGQHLQFSEILDNFKLEKFEPELCCDISVCNEEAVDFAPSFAYYAIPASQQTDYIWNDGVTGAQRTFTESGQYYLTIHLDCGTKRTNTIAVNLDDCLDEIFMPNVFSPNGDGLNDYVRPQLNNKNELVAFEFAIFDRWGNRVYLATTPDDPGWDGNFRQKSADAGVYLWSVSLVTQRGDEQKEQITTGDVLLIR